MSHLIVYAHPKDKSFNHAVLEAVKETLKSQNKKFEVRELYNLKFNPVLSVNDLAQIHEGKIPEDIKREQEYIRQAENIIFIYPVWWFGMPSILKGYIDRVFAYGFAYAVGDKGIKGLLKDKKVYILNTTGGPEENYQKFGFANALKTTTEAGIMEFCGMKVALHKYFYAVPTVDQQTRSNMLKEIQTLNLG
jgi:NAD(P)H dehydrogenase (quinone)